MRPAQVMMLVLMSLGGTFIWDRLCIYWFAPNVFQALVDEAKSVTLVSAHARALREGRAPSGRRVPDLSQRSAPCTPARVPPAAQADMLPAVKSLGKVFVVLMILGSGNIVVWGIAYFAYKKFVAAPTPAAMPARL
jgi:cation-transporting ATPase 13A1